jgi:hypothetical protein
MISSIDLKTKRAAFPLDDFWRNRNNVDDAQSAKRARPAAG